MINGKSILITGGTGSFGKAFVQKILTNYPEVKRLVVYSRDELKQSDMEQVYPTSKHPCMRYFIGDVRDGARLKRACEGIDTIIHAAALKQVPAAEYNPMECIKTNIFGAENVINAALDCGVKNVIALSTDKAAAPINLYGATKLCSDKLFIAANAMVGKRDLKLSVVRYGNVLGSRGSVIPLFLKMREQGVINITHEKMTRFTISLEDGVNLVLTTLQAHWGGEIFVPKIPSYRIVDVAEAIAPDAQKNVIGIRPGEKLHEEMITESDSYNTYEFKNYFIICPTNPMWNIENFKKQTGGKQVAAGFSYSSGSNDSWLSVDELRQQIKKHVDSNFEVISKTNGSNPLRKTTH
jgi:UDP-N-acetylglucosamine 4,6-dehydratase